MAASVGIETPHFDASTLDLVIGNLVEGARLRHGDMAVLRALAGGNATRSMR